MRIKRVLFPVDFSASSSAIAPFVHSMARRHQAAIVLLHVIQPAIPLYGGLTGDPAVGVVYPPVIDYREVRGILLQNLNDFGARELPKLEVSSVVDVGDPAALIVDFAEANAIDLICMPTQGHGAFRRALLGSVTAKVLHDAKMPVWITAHAPAPSHRAHPEPRYILAAIEPWEHARETLDAAVGIAKESGAELQIVTAVHEGMMAPGVMDPQLDDLLIEGTREKLAKLQFEAGTQVGTVIEIGGAATVVREAALSKRANLVICGRTTKHGIFGRFHNDNYAIIREAPCPVLTL